jgi:hypothetical protein
MTRINTGRLTTSGEQEVVVFRIGLWVHRLRAVHRWVPVVRAMVPMLRELYAQPELGFLGAEAHVGLRTIWHLQYWRGYEELLTYAHSRDHAHLPAWREFNRQAVQSTAVGIFHETYVLPAGAYETMYVHMPSFGMGAALGLVPATGQRATSRGRMGQRERAEQRLGIEPSGELEEVSR